MSHVLTIEIHAYWHAGSGRGEGMGLDATVVRTRGGLPYLPGRTLKGLMRDASQLAENLGHLQPVGRTEWLFGSPLPQPSQTAGTSYDAQQTATRYDTRPGRLRFSSARLGAVAQEQESWEHWANTQSSVVSNEGSSVAAIEDTALTQSAIDFFFEAISSTAIEEGLARSGTLRTTEVTVPLTLNGFIDADPDTDSQTDNSGAWHTQLQSTVLPLVRHLGKGRSRGLGRCTFRLSSQEADR